MPDHETPEFRPAPERASSTPRVIAAALACAVAAAASVSAMDRGRVRMIMADSVDGVTPS